MFSSQSHEYRNINYYYYTGTLKSAGTPTAKRKMLPSDDEDDFNDRLSEDNDEDEDIEEWGGNVSFVFAFFSVLIFCSK